MKSIVKNGRIIEKGFDSQKKLDIYMEDGIIKKIGENLEENGAEILNAEGKYDAMNKGISMSTGDVIAFINSDDWYVEGAFEAVCNAFNANACDVVCGDSYVIWRDDWYFLQKITPFIFIAINHPF